jgi:magnesium-transporting ATPase (P-type)
MEIFYLFNVRYMHVTSFSLRGALGTPVVLGAIAAAVIAQLAFTYAPFLQRLFETRPIPVVDGMLIVAIGAAMMAICEIEKVVMRRTGLLRRLEN